MTLQSVSTIFALSSGQPPAGVAVIRVSGPQAGPILDAFCGARPKPRLATLANLRDPHVAAGEDALIDQGLVLWFPGPHSFTGEDCAELQIHGSKAVIDRLVEVMARFPQTGLAEPGAFTRRAYDNHKMDLTEVEGLADLLSAETQAQRKLALRQALGGMGEIYQTWREKLIHIMAQNEAALDFIDEEDVPLGVAAQVRPEIEALHQDITAHLDDQHRGEMIRSGFRIVLIGAPNAGKSSLLNLLARRDVAIVSEEAGTTRDALEVKLNLGGHYVIVTDTAGLREGGGAIEREGMRRALQHAREAHLLIWLLDGAEVHAKSGAARQNLQEPPNSQEPQELAEYNGHVLRVLNKCDLFEAANEAQNAEKYDYQVSVKTAQGIEPLLAHIEQIIADQLAQGEDPLITRARHRHLLQQCAYYLAAYLANMPSAGSDAEADFAEEGAEIMDLELRAEDLRQAALALGRIMGRVDVEDVLDRIFGDFCIGK